MTKKQARRHTPGIYEITWKYGGGTSIAAVGKLDNGDSWFAPINWCNGYKDGVVSTNWMMVSRLEVVSVVR